MTTTEDRIQKVEQRRAALKRQVSEVGDLRPGSLAERDRRGGKSRRQCAGEGDVGHGPSWSLTREVASRAVTRVIPPDAVARTRAQVDEYHRFRRLARELVDTSEALCDARLEELDGAAAEAAPRRGLHTAFAGAIADQIEALVGPGAVDAWDLEAIEMAARRTALGLAARAAEQRLNADVSDHVGPTLPCPRCA